MDKLSSKEMKKLKGFLKKQDFIISAYMFGSCAKGTQGPLSDIDIAVSMDTKLGKREMDKKRLFLINKISGLIRTDKFDLVVMNNTTPLLRFNIIRDGMILKDTPKRAGLETRIISSHLDMKHFDDIYTNISLKRIEDKGIL